MKKHGQGMDWEMRHRAWAPSTPILCSQGGVPYNKPHLDAKDEEIKRLTLKLNRYEAALKSIQLDAGSHTVARLGPGDSKPTSGMAYIYDLTVEALSDD